MAPAFTKDTTVDEVVSSLAPLIRGKTILTTGVTANSLGGVFVAAVAAAQPALLILAGRSATKLHDTASALAAQHPAVKTAELVVDLASLSSVRAAAAQVMGWSHVPRIDVLVNNAAVMATDYALTEDGCETQFQVGHLGHFLLTNLVMDKILASEAPRVVSVSSDGHRLGGIRWGDPHFDVGFVVVVVAVIVLIVVGTNMLPKNGKTYHRWYAYGQAKTANILFAVALAQKLGPRGLQAFSLHPGGIFTTGLADHLDLASGAGFQELIQTDRALGNAIGWADWSTIGVSAEVGAATHAYAAFSPHLQDHNGAYLLQCRLSDPFTDTVRPWATSLTEAELLWRLSEKLVGQEFSYQDAGEKVR